MAAREELLEAETALTSWPDRSRYPRVSASFQHAPQQAASIRTTVENSVANARAASDMTQPVDRKSKRCNSPALTAYGVSRIPHSRSRKQVLKDRLASRRSHEPHDAQSIKNASRAFDAQRAQQ
jgi:hypothetical protein